MTISHRSLVRSLVVLGLACAFTVGASAQQSLGELARQARKDKPATEGSPKVITNDDLNSSAPAIRPEASTTENSSAEAADSSAKAPADAQAAPDKAAAAAADKDKAKPANADEEQAKLEKQWQDKLAAQKDQISLLERELDVLQRENKLRVANYYADAGSRLRNQAKYAEEDRKYHDDIQAKQKAIDDAKAKLADMKEEARKAGVPAGMLD